MMIWLPGQRMAIKNKSQTYRTTRTSLSEPESLKTIAVKVYNSLLVLFYL